MPFKVIIKKTAQKELAKLPQHVIKRVFVKIKELETNPTPFGSIQLNEFEIQGLNYDQLYRIRIGDYRMIYGIENNIVTISIIRIKHRKEVYK
ncbi:type II toxin-antitoxin system RelE/ParE family toxin [Lacihabitans sp. LS3-19]|uniref:type II toxin-antitoxin system RelE family toxin n=1 Tax=Lacihabitans sp. LS3-19 TaxID=2487335 RepID=UPI0020CBCCF5|nr:type II toxin-antitoxin system RelE/ParE family toxin [Lacihabitans sp. LS3-19]MCP9770620.1 type II toxin-antitoxin system RelE/ParE family toxin [Lacihabitans sp. LS3-19]